MTQKIKLDTQDKRIERLQEEENLTGAYEWLWRCFAKKDPELCLSIEETLKKRGIT